MYLNKGRKNTDYRINDNDIRSIIITIFHMFKKLKERLNM